MRWILSTVLILIATPAFAQENEAEKLFRAMEAKIQNAKSLTVASESEIVGDSGGKPGKLIGSVHLAESNKARLEFEMNMPGFPSPFMIVSDGKQTASRNEQGREQWLPAKPNDTYVAKAAISRAGLATALLGFRPGPLFITESEDIDINKLAAISDFKLGIKEKLGDREVQVVECQMKMDMLFKGDRFKCQIWIDPKSMTPLKRLVYHPNPPNQLMIGETYTEFLINPQLDPKLFELPK